MHSWDFNDPKIVWEIFFAKEGGMGGRGRSTFSNHGHTCSHHPPMLDLCMPVGDANKGLPEFCGFANLLFTYSRLGIQVRRRIQRWRSRELTENYKTWVSTDKPRDIKKSYAKSANENFWIT